MTDGWDELQRGAAAGNRPARKPAGRRFLTALVILVVAAIVVVGGAFLAETVTRGIAEDSVAAAAEASLPSNVEGTVDVDIAGDWVLLQLLSGRMDTVTLTSADARFDDIPVENVRVAASGVPLDLKSAIDDIAATASLDQPALNELLTLPGNDPELTLNDDTVGYEDSTTFFGIPVGYRVTASLVPDGTDVLLTPESAEVTTVIGDLDLSGLVEQIVGSEPIRICVAEKLPEGVTISGIEVRNGLATLDLSASNFVLSGQALRTTGECPA